MGDGRIAQDVDHNERRQFLQLLDRDPECGRVFAQHDERFNATFRHTGSNSFKVRSGFILQAQNQFCAIGVGISILAQQNIIPLAFPRNDIDKRDVQMLRQTRGQPQFLIRHSA